MESGITRTHSNQSDEGGLDLTHSQTKEEAVMKHIVCVGIILATVLLSISTFGGVIGKTDKGVRTIAEPILDSILEGFKTSDYTKYSKDFDDTLKGAISQKKISEVNHQIKSSIGNYRSREYLGFLTKGRMTVVLWRGRFGKSEDDVLIRLVVSKRGNKYLVTGPWFQ